eukprot:768520-Hanusia_phi.AAC.3
MTSIFLKPSLCRTSEIVNTVPGTLQTQMGFHHILTQSLLWQSETFMSADSGKSCFESIVQQEQDSIVIVIVFNTVFINSAT